MFRMLREFLRFLGREKKWWLVPVVLVLLLLGLAVAFSSSPAVAPFLYPFL